MALTDSEAMQLALSEARLAAAAGEVPVGAVILKDGQVIAVGRNAPIHSHDPTAHAEIVALRAASQVLGNYRLDGCEMFVTLEPCSMCSGAMLHARIQRVVFGAADPKTGAAGSVLNLFAQPLLNHRTQIEAGMLADASAELLQDFFQKRRAENRQVRHALREDALRTPDDQFANLADFPWAPHYVSDLCSLAGLRMAYVDEGLHTAAPTYICLHDTNSWNYQYRQMLPPLVAAGYRVLLPDLVGFGRSDKPKKQAVHSIDWHCRILLEWMQQLELRNVILVIQGQSLLSNSLLAKAPETFYGVLALAPALPHLTDDLPFPDRGHRAAPQAFAALTAASGQEPHAKEIIHTRLLQLSLPPDAQAAVQAVAYFKSN
jgi:tRNA(adenine34) deaminase